MTLIAERLADLGHEVILSLAEPYAESIQHPGVKAEVIVDTATFEGLIDDAQLWRPLRGARKIFRFAADIFFETYIKVIEKYHDPGRTVLVQHPLDFASRAFRDAFPDTPLATVHLAPSMLRPASRPARMTPFWYEVRRPLWLRRFAELLVDQVLVDPVLNKTINRWLISHGCDPVRRFVDHWWVSPDKLLLMYPEWFAPETSDVPHPIVHCGFPIANEQTSKPTQEILTQTCQPWVFTAGTAHRHAREFFQRATDIICRRSSDAVFVCRYPDLLPNDLPSNIEVIEHTQLLTLFEHASLVMHHGGVGTTARAVRSRTPQIIYPFAFDQFDNAARIQESGAGVWLKSLSHLEEAIDEALALPAQTKKPWPDAAQIAASEIERLAVSKFRRQA
ncbi:MAG: nucleotide disphospho-sugar-binding domain-containing protein [Planctomycetota bacterium]